MHLLGGLARSTLGSKAVTAILEGGEGETVPVPRHKGQDKSHT